VTPIDNGSEVKVEGQVQFQLLSSVLVGLWPLSDVSNDIVHYFMTYCSSTLSSSNK